MPNLQSSVEVPDHVLVRIIDGEAVLLNLDDEFYYGLDEVSTEFWQAITDTPTLSAAAERLSGMFDVDDERLRTDFAAFVDELVKSNLLQYAS